VAGKISNTKAPEQTFQEVKYLKRLIDDQVPVRVRLSDNQEVEGTIEFYDANFIRITRNKQTNLFLFKHDNKYLYQLS
jgi:small nuclear ribonucleoprotein (snRNP)-like protein